MNRHVSLKDGLCRVIPLLDDRVNAIGFERALGRVQGTVSGGKKRPQYVFRPQLSIPDHRKAWIYLQQMPANQRKDFLVRAILAEEQRDTFKQMLRDVIREELTHGGVIQESTKPTAEKEVPKQTLDFLASLCD